MSAGRITGVLERAEATPERLMTLMTTESLMDTEVTAEEILTTPEPTPQSEPEALADALVEHDGAHGRPGSENDPQHNPDQKKDQ